ncbi:MAG: hypothetical protein ACP5GJ_04320, partial [Nanopusillaceae archaeon]
NTNYYQLLYPYVGISAYWYCYEEGYTNYTNISQCPNYGQYDNGQDVFNLYTNFAGNSLPAGWTWTVLSNPTGSSGSIIVNNSLTIFNTNGYDFWCSDYMITLVYYENLVLINQIFETLVTNLQGNSADTGWTKAGILYQNQVNTAASNGEIDMIVTNGAGYTIQWQTIASEIAPCDSSGGNPISYPSVIALIAPNNYNVGGFYGPYLDYLTQVGNYVTPTSISPQGFIGLFITSHNSNDYTSTATFQYFLARAYPPNGVMPSIYIG